MPITHSPRDFFALRRTSDIQPLRHDRFGLSFFERLGYRSIDLVLDPYLRQAFSLSLRLSSKVILPNIPRLLLLALTEVFLSRRMQLVSFPAFVVELARRFFQNLAHLLAVEIPFIIGEHFGDSHIQRHYFLGRRRQDFDLSCYVQFDSAAFRQQDYSNVSADLAPAFQRDTNPISALQPADRDSLTGYRIEDFVQAIVPQRSSLPSLRAGDLS